MTAKQNSTQLSAQVASHKQTPLRDMRKEMGSVVQPKLSSHTAMTCCFLLLLNTSRQVCLCQAPHCCLH